MTDNPIHSDDTKPNKPMIMGLVVGFVGGEFMHLIMLVADVGVTLDSLIQLLERPIECQEMVERNRSP